MEQVLDEGQHCLDAQEDEVSHYAAELKPGSVVAVSSSRSNLLMP